MTECGEKRTFCVVRVISGLACVHQLMFQDLALIDVDPAAKQPLQLAARIEKRHRPLVNVESPAVELQLPINKQRLLRRQLLHVPGMQACGRGLRHQAAFHQGQALDQLPPGGQLLLIAGVTGHQPASQVPYKDRIGHAIQQGTLEGQLIAQSLLGHQALLDLPLEPAIPDQRYQHTQQRHRDRPIGPWRHTLPSRRRDRHRAQPAQTQRAQLGHRHRFQRLVHNAQQLGLVLAHHQAVGRPLALHAAPDAQAVGRVALHLHFILDRRRCMPLDHLVTGLGIVVDGENLDAWVFTANEIFQHMPGRQRQDLARKLTQAGQ